ncbi:MAG: SBBP repeat-containing protein [Bryobacteraceae bacterium]
MTTIKRLGLRNGIVVALAWVLCPALQAATPPWFEPNRGQLVSSVGFVARVDGYTVAFNKDGSATYVLSSASKAPEVLHMQLLGSQPGQLSGERLLSSFTRYYGGAQSERGGLGVEVPHYSGIRYYGAYPGIDLQWHTHGQHLEYEFHVAAGGEPDALRIGFTGQKSVAIDGDGDLVVSTPSGAVRYRHPEGWQEIDGRQVPVGIEFRVEADIVGFDVGSYDATRPLRIDPVLEFSTYVGGSGFDAAYAVATDSAGNVYTTGETASVDLPSSGGGTGVRNTRAVFVSKLSSDGTHILFTTILASAGNDSGRGIALDNSGNIWVAGIAGSSGFPATSNALKTASNGGQDGFIAMLDSTGRLSYATYLGGTGTDAAMGIAVDLSGVYVTGYTSSTNFPTTSGAPQAAFQGGFSDAFVLKMDRAGTRWIYSTLLGGSGSDTAVSLAIDVAGDACIAGRTDSSSLPLRNALQTSNRGSGDILLGCLNPTGTSWNFMTYLGGSGNDEANGITLDSSGNIYLTGDTLSTNFPVTSGAYQTVSHGDYEAFVVKLNATGTAINFASLLGGSGSDSGTAIAVGSSGTVWIAGYTGSVNFPTTVAPGFSGSLDGFFAQLSSTGASLQLAGYLGGASDDRCLAMTLSNGEPVLAGMTGSVDFPTTTGVVQSIHPAPFNALISQLSLNPTAVSVSPSSGTGSSQTFSTVYSNPNGASDLISTQILINTTFGAVSACYIQLNPADGSSWLLSDTAAVWLGPITLGGAGTLQNSQCTLNASGSSVIVSGNTATMILVLNFKAAFVGPKAVYGFAQTAHGLNSGWTTLGTWTVPGNSQPPQAVSVNPSSGTGSSQTFSTVYSNPNGASDLISTQMLINATFGAVSACYIQINPTDGSSWLLSDTAAVWLGPITLGGTGTLQNSQCTLNASGSSIIVSGNTATARVLLTFKPSFAGTKTVNGFAQTAHGLNSGWIALGTWIVPGNSQPPQAVSVNPSSGTGSSQTFSTVYSNPQGASDLVSTQILINTAFGAVSACYIQLNPADGSSWLLSDTAAVWLGPITLGGAGTLQNSQCTLNASGSSVIVSGNTAAMVLVLNFKAAFAGPKAVYGFSQTGHGLNSGWTTLGTWTVPGNSQPPQAVSVNPSSGTGSSQTFSTVYSNPNGASDLISTQMLINATFGAVSACYIQINPTDGSSWLLSDTAAVWLGPITLGGTGTLQNSQCTLNASGSSIIVSGNTATARVLLTFKPSFAGTKTVNGFAQTAHGLNSGWIALGTWAVPSGP